MFKKKATDATIGDSVKYTAIVTAISFVPVLIIIGWDKIKRLGKMIASKVTRKEGDR